MLVTHLHHASSFLGGDFLRHSQVETLFLKGKASAIQLLDYVIAFYLKILSLTTEQSCPQPKASFRPCLNIQLKSFELLCFALCRERELFKPQIQMAAEDLMSLNILHTFSSNATHV